MNAELEWFVKHLNAGPRVYRPEGESWKDMIQSISTPGTVSEIAKEIYTYFLEVLPPHYQNRSPFAFAEGKEPFRLFWQGLDERYWVRQLTWDETTAFCRMAGIPSPS